jgi:GAF domain/Phosphoserine phosphatase RsbU, N-terminal domain
MTSRAQNELRRSYASALQAYLRDTEERTLHAAYELGREAVSRELGVLDLALVHHEALAATLRGAEPKDVDRLVRSAADFLLDSLSAFEMIRRAYTEAREEAALERRQATLLRQLSNLLADTSLALDASGSLDEMLRLVAEQALELTHASVCVAALAGTSDDPEVEAAAYAEPDDHESAFARSADVRALARLVRSAERPVRLSRRELAAHRASPDAGPPGGWLAAPLATLDGRQIGWIQLFGGGDAEFGEIDEAVLAHLAQMTSATVERVRLYSP